MGKKIPIEQRFWNRLKKVGDCWEWQAARVKGYGFVKWHRKQMKTHRVAWELTNGPIPDGLFVCHSCDNPPCCNPAHLWLGTNRDNQIDAARKGRSARAQAPRSPLTESDVVDIRSVRAFGARQAVIAREFGISQQLVSRICAGQIWRHVA